MAGSPRAEQTSTTRVEAIRRARRTYAWIVQIPYLIVLLAGVVAAMFVLFDRWRRGTLVLGSALLVGSLFRALLPSSRVGLLQVRGRLFDSVAMAVTGVAILWLAYSIDSLGTD